eukprot:8805-Heterococcus_DN1.PRE.1
MKGSNLSSEYSCVLRWNMSPYEQQQQQSSVSVAVVTTCCCYSSRLLATDQYVMVQRRDANTRKQ